MNANHMTIGLIGLGLIGGSIAKTIRRIHPDSIIYGFDTDIDSLKMAKEDEMNHREIAETLNVKLCTVERQLLLAKAKIKEAIKPFLEKI